MDGLNGADGLQGPPGLQGPIGATGAAGATGPTGPGPIIATNGGLLGAGTSSDPLRLDATQVASKLEGGRLLEAEGAVTSAVSVGVVQADTTASAGSVRFASASAMAGGTLWRVEKAQAGGALGLDRAEVSARMKVTNTLSSSVLANLRCGAIRAGQTAFVDVGTAAAIRPSHFAAGKWRTVEIVCNFLPDDVDQYVALSDFVVGITDLSIDYARVAPAPAGPTTSAKNGYAEFTTDVVTNTSSTANQTYTLLDMRCSGHWGSYYVEIDLIVHYYRPSVRKYEYYCGNGNYSSGGALVEIRAPVATAPLAGLSLQLIGDSGKVHSGINMYDAKVIVTQQPYTQSYARVRTYGLWASYKAGTPLGNTDPYGVWQTWTE